MSQRLNLIFKALADETRLRMIQYLTRHEELCVCDFMALLDITQSKASRHLRYLFNAGLLLDRREAVWIYYRLNAPAGRPQSILLEAIRSLTTQETSRELDRQLKHRMQMKGCQS